MNSLCEIPFTLSKNNKYTLSFSSLARYLLSDTRGMLNNTNVNSSNDLIIHLLMRENKCRVLFCGAQFWCRVAKPEHMCELIANLRHHQIFIMDSHEPLFGKKNPVHNAFGHKVDWLDFHLDSRQLPDTLNWNMFWNSINVLR